MLSSDRITSRSISLRSSRTLPGHEYAARMASASSEMGFTFIPFSRQASSTNAAVSSGTSSARSRSGGARRGTTFSRKYRSSRNSPAATAACRSRLVAAMTRTSTFSTCSPPTRENSPDCRTRSTLAWAERFMSPISSRKIVPPSAISNKPALARRRAGERAALVAEQLGLDQLLGDGGAVHLHEGLGRQRAGSVDGLGDQLFAGSRLAGDQDARAGRRHLRDLRLQRLHGRAVADHLRSLLGDRRAGLPPRGPWPAAPARSAGRPSAARDRAAFRSGHRRRPWSRARRPPAWRAPRS